MYRPVAYILLPLLLLLGFSSCDCTRYTYGYVADYETKKIIKGAKVYSYAALDDKIRDERTQYTDTTGWFETAFALNGVAKCGSLKLVISKDSFQTASVVDMEMGDTVFLYRQPNP